MRDPGARRVGHNWPMSHTFLALLILVLFSFPSFAGYLKSCPQAPDNSEGKSIADYAPLMRANRITVAYGTPDVKWLDAFFYELNKFPANLLQEMVDAGATIHLIQGNAVTDDPTWDPSQVTTVEGKRTFNHIPGTGGSPFAYEANRRSLEDQRNYRAGMRRYCQRYRSCDPAAYPDLTASPKDEPTRFVINLLYNHDPAKGSSHGSTNLVLHEHGHALDSIFAYHGLSQKASWQAIMNNPANRDFLVKLCPDNYCLRAEEGYAESFAYYHNCEETRAHLEEVAPEIAEYFRNFTSVRSLAD